MDRYPDILKKAREKALQSANSTNLADAKGHGPKGMRTEVWDGLVDIWLTSEWQRKSEVAKMNKSAVPDATLHTSGSISYRCHKMKMEASSNQRVSYRDVYHKTHKNKAGDFVSERSKRFAENLDAAMSQKYGEDISSFPEVDNDVWLDVAGPSKKGRVYGLGNSLPLANCESSQGSSASNMSTTSKEANMREVVKEVVCEQITPLMQMLSRFGNFQPPDLATTPPSTANEDAAEKNNDANLGLH